MADNSEFTVRTATVLDIKNLKKFFISAYGEQTVFQNEQFLMYYFGSKSRGLEPLGACLIGLSPESEIISHYGGLYYKLKINQKIISLIWGVNAYTLPEWRGKGINSKIVNYLYNNNEANAVIGMPFDAPFFYEKLGYNIFKKETLTRFIYILDEKSFDIINQIGQDVEKAIELLPMINSSIIVSENENIVELTKCNFNDYELDLHLHADIVATTYRDIDFLNWRLFENPYINYKVFGYLKNRKIITYIALREEILEPNNLKVNRIIDLFGEKEGVKILLNFVISKSLLNKQIYIDFSVYGKLYDEELISAGFNKLENDDVCLLPQVTAPIENRPNHEYIVIQSKHHERLFKDFSKENVYFTRIDGDRDRISKINQIRTKE